MSAVPGAENQVVRYQRMEVNALAEAYMQDKAKVEKELRSVTEMLHHVAMLHPTAFIMLLRSIQQPYLQIFSF